MDRFFKRRQAEGENTYANEVVWTLEEGAKVPEDNVKNPFEKVTVDDAVRETESDNKHEKYAEERYGKR